MEKYSSGRRGAPAKGVDRVTGARVQISPSPPNLRVETDPVRKTQVFLRFFIFPPFSSLFEKQSFNAKKDAKHRVRGSVLSTYPFRGSFYDEFMRITLIFLFLSKNLCK